ncbi:hypothetical protein [Pseudorhodoferax soli]|uniref:Uncharacterized protein n=1 Tax=Pseudorhodoferax soli TaxID=545864 RepID=A0A368XBN7_9BURK|nr:hypothetical protein [Pseudorhodoferax soli]RCW65129.1 hypothetical protein DES41_11353 [Pseudorhodoferax soli]
MSQDKSNAGQKLFSVEHLEQQTWVGFYPEARKDAALAAEILTELERDEDFRRRHRGLYLCCQRSIRIQEYRDMRQQRIGAALRRLFAVLFVAWPAAAVEVARRTRNLAVDCLPETSQATTDHRVRRLMESDAFSQADRSFRDRAREAADRSDDQMPTVAMGDRPTPIRPTAAS